MLKFLFKLSGISKNILLASLAGLVGVLSLLAILWIFTILPADAHITFNKINDNTYSVSGPVNEPFISDSSEQFVSKRNLFNRLKGLNPMGNPGKMFLNIDSKELTTSSREMEEILNKSVRKDSNTVRISINQSEVRYLINKNALHPNDPGNLLKAQVMAWASKSPGSLSYIAKISGKQALVGPRPSVGKLFAASNKSPHRNFWTLSGFHPISPSINDKDSLIASGGSLKDRIKPLKLATNIPTSFGHLAARFESGKSGSNAIGYTPAGGTCYGIYQIASATGTFNNFLRFLDSRAPELALRLRAAGPANTGGTTGPAVDEWRNLAAEYGQAFSKLQHEFIYLTHYRPVIMAIHAQTGLDMQEASPGLREMIWSAAVQHGPGAASAIFVKSIKKLRENNVAEGNNKVFSKSLIESVYDLRKGRASYLNKRYEKEKDLVLALDAEH